jgi:hypothetical protein
VFSCFSKRVADDAQSHLMSGKSCDIESLTAAISNVTIKKMTLEQCHNTFSVPVGVSINCIPSSECVDTGDAYAFTTIPCTTVNSPQVNFDFFIGICLISIYCIK